MVLCFVNLINWPHPLPMKRWRILTHRQNHLVWIANSCLQKDLGNQRRSFDIAAGAHKETSPTSLFLSTVPAHRLHPSPPPHRCPRIPALVALPSPLLIPILYPWSTQPPDILLLPRSLCRAWQLPNLFLLNFSHILCLLSLAAMLGCM